MVVWTFHDVSVEDESEKFLRIVAVARHDLLCSYTSADPKRRAIERFAT